MQRDAIENATQLYDSNKAAHETDEAVSQCAGSPGETALLMSRDIDHVDLPPTPQFARRRFLRTAATATLAFAGGLGVGFWQWGLPQVANTAPTPATPVPPVQPPASLALPESYGLPIAYGRIGPQLIRAGALDYDAFVSLFDQDGTPLTEEQRTILREGSDATIAIDLSNARFLLNLFWAVGLANNNDILLRGAMVTKSQGKVEGYASTGGWTLTTRPLHEVYSGSVLASPTAPQQTRLEEAAAAIYRPCCDNPTSFPDCNHGMAMLGLLELMAARDASIESMLDAAKQINRFWFPDQTHELALYYQAQGTGAFDAIPAAEAVGARRFSATGYGELHDWLVANGALQTPGGSANKCGV